MRAHILRSLCRLLPPNQLGWRVERLLDATKLPAVVTCRTRDGLLLQVRTDDFVQRKIYLTGTWDEEVADALRGCLRSGDTFVDVGANVGFFTTLGARLVGPQGRVVAFEPMPASLEALRHNVRLNGMDRQVIIRAVAVSDRGGIGLLTSPDSANAGAATLRKTVGPTTEVSLSTLDDQLAECGVQQVRLMKLDIEGAELQALKGAKRLLAERQPEFLVCEVSEFSLQQLGGTRGELMSLMGSYGYRPRILSRIRGGWRPEIQDLGLQFDVLFERA